MTHARWKQDGFDAHFVATEIAKNVSPLPEGGLRYSGDALFGDPLILLDTGVEFLTPVSETDRSRIIRAALESALRFKNYDPKVLIGEINKVTNEFVRSPDTAYVVTTGLSFKHFRNLSSTRGGTRLYVRSGFPHRFAKAREEARARSRRTIRGEYPEEKPFKRYAAAWLHVRGRSVTEAMDEAVAALDLNRGVWNFALNRAGASFPSPSRGPINGVLAGPLFTLHHQDGSLAAHYDWYDPEYDGPRLSDKPRKDWHRVVEDEGAIYKALKRSPYREVLEDAMRRYCRALDTVDLARSFLELWSLLETLTGIGPGDSYDRLVRRASFVFMETERKTHEQVLYHLRRHRNTSVHAGQGSDEVGAYLHQVRRYAEHLLLFHLRTSRRFSSFEAVVSFLDLPSEPSDLRHLIENQKRTAQKAADAARLAERGLRFREGKQI